MSELVRISAHNVLQAVFDDILGNPEWKKRDKELCKQWPDYDAAWKYVEEHGYKEIIKQLRNSYREIEQRHLNRRRGSGSVYSR